jgi:ABC-2 type transport system permease protein
MSGPGAIAAVIRKELIQTMRDRRMLPLLLVAPLVQTLVFGYAVNLDLDDQPVVISDHDGSPASREIAVAVRTAASFELAAVVRDDDEAEQMVREGRAALAILVPRGYARDLDRGQGRIFVALDGSDANTALRASQELSLILGQRAAALSSARFGQVLAARGLDPGSALPAVELRPRAMFNPRLETAVFLVPGVLALVLAVITMVMTSMALAREKEVGTLEQVMVSPLRPIELMLGKALPFAFFGLLEVALVICLARLVFDVPMTGSLVAVFAVSAIYLMTTLGLGLLISTFSSTQQQALLNAFFVLLPALMLSGYVFPVEHMPAPVQWLTVLNPLRYYIELVRGLMVKGATIADMAPSLAALTALGSSVLIAASLRFRKRAA